MLFSLRRNSLSSPSSPSLSPFFPFIFAGDYASSFFDLSEASWLALWVKWFTFSVFILFFLGFYFWSTLIFIYFYEAGSSGSG